MDNSAILGLVSKLRFEISLILQTYRIFGFSKAIRFIISLPNVLIKGENGPAYDALGHCRMTLEENVVVFEHPNVRFIDEIILRRCYDGKTGFHIERDSIVVDAGANVGVFSILAATIADHGLVISIEPDKANFRYLSENVSANKLRNVVLVNAALANFSGSSILYVDNSGSNSVIKPSVRSRSDECQTTTLSDLFHKYEIHHVNFMKIDIEGAEFLLFDETDWLDKVDRIVMEVHPTAGMISTIVDKLSKVKFHVQISPAYDGGLFYIFAKR